MAYICKIDILTETPEVTATVSINPLYSEFLNNHTQIRVIAKTNDLLDKSIVKLETYLLSNYKMKLLSQITDYDETIKNMEKHISKLKYDVNYLLSIKNYEYDGLTLCEPKYATSLSMSPDAPPYTPPLMD